MTRYIKYRDKYFKIYRIKYIYKNGFRGEQTILSSCDNSEQLTNIVSRQLKGAKKARFKVLTSKKVGKKAQQKVVEGWLLDMDLRSFSIE